LFGQFLSAKHFTTKDFKGNRKFFQKTFLSKTSMVKKNHLVCYALLLFLLCHLACKSDERSLPKPGEFALVAPVDSATGAALTPVFVWQTSDNATSYKLIISLNSDFSGSMEVADIQTNSYQLQTELAANTRYFWKVVSVSDGGEQSAVNSGLCFRTLASPPKPSPGISVYHVSPVGDDNPGRGTREMPFKTLAYAATMVPPGEGDTIKLSAGTFFETEPALIPMGVHVKGAGENATIISSRGVKINPGVNTTDKDFKLWYDGSLIQLVSPGREAFRIKSSPAIAPEDGNQTISGFTIDGNGKKLKAGIWVENRNNVTMHHVSFRNIQQRGAVFAAGNRPPMPEPMFTPMRSALASVTCRPQSFQAWIAAASPKWMKASMWRASFGDR
jgi:hypothetical protein